MTYISANVLVQMDSLLNSESLSVSDNQFSDFQMLQMLGDTFPTMSWLYFKSVLERNGFVEDFHYQISSVLDDEFALFIHPQKGLLVWADSYGGIIRNGALYGQMQTESSSVERVRLDIRIGLMHQLHRMSTKGEFHPIWKEDQFLWLLDYNEEDEFRPHKEIALEKIKHSSEQLQRIVGCCLHGLAS